MAARQPQCLETPLGCIGLQGREARGGSHARGSISRPHYTGTWCRWQAPFVVAFPLPAIGQAGPRERGPPHRAYRSAAGLELGHELFEQTAALDKVTKLVVAGAGWRQENHIAGGGGGVGVMHRVA